MVLRTEEVCPGEVVKAVASISTDTLVQEIPRCWSSLVKAPSTRWTASVWLVARDAARAGECAAVVTACWPVAKLATARSTPRIRKRAGAMIAASVLEDPRSSSRRFIDSLLSVLGHLQSARWHV